MNNNQNLIKNKMNNNKKLIKTLKYYNIIIIIL